METSVNQDDVNQTPPLESEAVVVKKKRGKERTALYRYKEDDPSYYNNKPLNPNYFK